jgi:hypothetical protein
LNYGLAVAHFRVEFNAVIKRHVRTPLCYVFAQYKPWHIFYQIGALASDVGLVELVLLVGLVDQQTFHWLNWLGLQKPSPTRRRRIPATPALKA